MNLLQMLRHLEKGVVLCCVIITQSEVKIVQKMMQYYLYQNQRFQKYLCKKICISSKFWCRLISQKKNYLLTAKSFLAQKNLTEKE